MVIYLILWTTTKTTCCVLTNNNTIYLQDTLLIHSLCMRQLLLFFLGQHLSILNCQLEIMTKYCRQN